MYNEAPYYHWLTHWLIWMIRYTTSQPHRELTFYTIISLTDSGTGRLWTFYYHFFTRKIKNVQNPMRLTICYSKNWSFSHLYSILPTAEVQSSFFPLFRFLMFLFFNKSFLFIIFSQYAVYYYYCNRNCNLTSNFQIQNKWLTIIAPTPCHLGNRRYTFVITLHRKPILS